MAVGCRALVDGRRPGPVKRFAFDEAAAEAGRAAHGDGELAMSNHGGLHTGSLERTSEATSHARSAAENARIGRPGAEEQRSKLHQDCAGSDDHGSPGVKPRKHRSALRQRPKLESRRQAKLHSVARPVSGSGLPSSGFVRPLAQDESVISQARAQARRSGKAAGNRTVRRVLVRYSRLQKSERRIFPVANEAARRREQGIV